MQHVSRYTIAISCQHMIPGLTRHFKLNLKAVAFVENFTTNSWIYVIQFLERNLGFLFLNYQPENVRIIYSISIENIVLT